MHVLGGQVIVRIIACKSSFAHSMCWRSGFAMNLSVRKMVQEKSSLKVKEILCRRLRALSDLVSLSDLLWYHVSRIRNMDTWIDLSHFLWRALDEHDWLVVFHLSFPEKVARLLTEQGTHSLCQATCTACFLLWIVGLCLCSLRNGPFLNSLMQHWHLCRTKLPRIVLNSKNEKWS